MRNRREFFRLLAAAACAPIAAVAAPTSGEGVVLNGKRFLAFDSAADRLHVYDPPTRYYRVRYIVKDGDKIIYGGSWAGNDPSKVTFTNAR